MIDMDIEVKAKMYAEDLGELDDRSTFDSLDINSARYVAFKAGAEWKSFAHSKAKIEKFARNNQGKAVSIEVENCKEQGVIAGYVGDCIIVAVSTTSGWTDLSEDDVLLIQSPSYKYFWYSYIEDLKFI